MRYLLVLSLLCMAACGAPSGYFRQVPATRIAVNGSVFDVRMRGNLAEAIRVTPQYAPRFGPIRTRAGLAMALVSGCSVTAVLGDQAQAVGRMDCPGDPTPRLRVHQACRLSGAAGGAYPAYRCAVPG